MSKLGDTTGFPAEVFRAFAAFCVTQPVFALLEKVQQYLTFTSTLSHQH